VAGNPEKDLTAVKVQQRVVPEKAKAGDEDLSTGTITIQNQNLQAHPRLISKPDSLQSLNTPGLSNPKVVIKENPVATVSEKETPPLAEKPVKDLTTVKVQQQVGSEKAKNEPYSYAPNNITTTSAIPTNPKIIEAAAEISLRKKEVIRTIDFSSDSLTLVLYDNGIVDGDTVSVVLNDIVIIPKQGLTEQGYRKVIKIPPGSGDSLQLVIYAENLGSIPPNSGLLIIEDGSDRYEVGFQGDMKKSSTVKLRRKR
jgi:hypothetical protein